LDRNCEQPRFSLKSLFAGFTIFVLLMTAATGLYRQRQLADRDSIEQAARNFLVLIGQAVSQYDSEKQTWPPIIPLNSDGSQRSSWRFQIHNFVPVYWLSPPEDLNAPWNSPANQAIAAEDGAPFNRPIQGRDSRAWVYGVVGPGTAFDSNEVSRLRDVPGNAILAMEVADSKTHWMQPGDYDVTTLLAASGKLGDHVKSILPHRIHVLFADSDVWTLSDDTPMDAVKPFLTVAGAKGADRDKTLEPYRVD